MKKLKIVSIVILIFACLSVPLLNRISYDTWNITAYPKKISFFGRDYYRTGEHFEFLKGDKKPKYEVSSIFDKLTGKKFYTATPKKDDFDPCVIYLYTGDDKYLIFVLSGGP